ncbi:Cof-type HAD-IIB family hydrolase [Catenovulum sp. SM1970]|uniref:HAD family hydrolase n=1 Tax=Marinifaba aquimaris TaxID=2741323 RepID=UPI001571FB12|nr:Cof-type HAD-IIB family hydrolase [Marinifaba aquimaris]NTS76225.1 Cof-type HAD-IIB family hydrolase [Marinifaba aquimaris]
MNKPRHLVVFDLDGTLLNKDSKLSALTQQTLTAMHQQGIHYTLATGRSYQSANAIIEHELFFLPQIYTNGVLTWCPNKNRFSFDNCLTVEQGVNAIKAMESTAAAPFLSAIDSQEQKYIFHGKLQNQVEEKLLARFSEKKGTQILPVEQIKDGLHVTNISMIGPSTDVLNAEHNISKDKQLIAYSGPAMSQQDYRWIDVHHAKATKGSAVEKLKSQLEVDNIICFGDGDNDLSMFEIANESYAPANANEQVKQAATSVIGHHDEDGVALFLKERFGV